MVEMEKSLGQQYALQVAVQTMKERCLQLQQRLTVVEEENMHLRMKYNTECIDLTDDISKTEAEVLREKVAQLTKQKSQLTHNVLMVATENRHLWNRLSKLTQANQTLGNQLTKLSDTLNHCASSPLAQSSPSNLIRSRTFTLETPPEKLVLLIDKDIYIDTSLEDISLKLLNSIAEEKSELEKQCVQMAEMQSNSSFPRNYIGFTYPNDEFDECTVAEITQNIEKVKYFKESLLNHREKLKNTIGVFKKIYASGVLCKTCKQKSQCAEKESQTDKYSASEVKLDIAPKVIRKHDETEDEKICPMCCKSFDTAPLTEFVVHVESHFSTDTDTYFLDNLNFEVVTSATDLEK